MSPETTMPTTTHNTQTVMTTQSTSPTLNRILQAQEGKVAHHPPYGVALAEIKQGRKSRHWIWYVIPSLRGVRDTSHPELMLENLDTVREYMDHEVLWFRLHEICDTAKGHLEKGVNPRLLFGGSTDATKFWETCSLFAIVAHKHSLSVQFNFFVSILPLVQAGALETKTMKCVVAVAGYEHYRNVKNVKDLSPLSNTE
eukprot:c25865_g1_i1.p1 GENE.c25865_g1_i1~~c25865_g1_i1.p1  ORF type:complete len:209 (+),score=49.15 c25865_g1_i1:33-629(+)